MGWFAQKVAEFLDRHVPLMPEGFDPEPIQFSHHRRREPDGRMIHRVTFGDPRNGLCWQFDDAGAEGAMAEIARAVSRKECGLTWREAAGLIREVRERVSGNAISGE